MRRTARRPPRRERGFAMITVVFLVVILASIVGTMAGLRERGSQATVLDVRQARASLAARAALEWGAWKVGDPEGTGTPGASQLPPCFTSPASLSLPGVLAEFAVTVSCERSPAADATPPHYEEDAQRLAIYTITAVASAGAPDSPDRVQRTVRMRIEGCRDPASIAPNHAC